jgi:hypothetical protein
MTRRSLCPQRRCGFLAKPVGSETALSPTVAWYSTNGPDAKGSWRFFQSGLSVTGFLEGTRYLPGLAGGH